MITALLAGSLFCMALFAIGVSLFWKNVVRRRMELQRRDMAFFYNGPQHNYIPNSIFTQTPNLMNAFEQFPMNPGEMDAPLFSSLLLREPPPSYHQAMGGSYVEQPEVEINRSYLDFYRRNRRRSSRTHRSTRQRSVNQSVQTSDDTLSASLAVPENPSLMSIFRGTFLNRRIDSQSSLQVNVGGFNSVAFESNESNDDSKEEAIENKEDTQSQPQQQPLPTSPDVQSANEPILSSTNTSPMMMNDANSTHYVSTSSLVVNCDGRSMTSSSMNIELETLSPVPTDVTITSPNSSAVPSTHPAPSHFDCDFQPLISPNQLR